MIFHDSELGVTRTVETWLRPRIQFAFAWNLKMRFNSFRSRAAPSWRRPSPRPMASDGPSVVGHSRGKLSEDTHARDSFWELSLLPGTLVVHSCGTLGILGAFCGAGCCNAIRNAIAPTLQPSALGAPLARPWDPSHGPQDWLLKHSVERPKRPQRSQLPRSETRRQSTIGSGSNVINQPVVQPTMSDGSLSIFLERKNRCFVSKGWSVQKKGLESLC